MFHLQKNLHIQKKSVTFDNSKKNRVGDYVILSKFFEKEGIQLFKAIDSNEFLVSLKRRKIDNLQDFYYTLSVYETPLKDKYLMIAKDLIL